MAGNILEFNQVTSNQKEKFGLKDISFALPGGYIMGLMGANGAGKTTLFEYIMSDEKRYSGVIRLNGTDISENRRVIKNKIAYVSEKKVFFERMTGIRNAEVLANLYEEFDLDLFRKTMEKMGVPDIHYQKLSRGEKIKFQLAFAMAHRPILYLLDEVTAGMDPVYRTEFFQILQEIIWDGKASVIITSQIENEMEKKVDCLGVIANGRLVDFGEAIDVVPRIRKETVKLKNLSGV